MKSIEEIKEEYAILKGFSNWYALYKDHVFRINEYTNHMDNVTKRYATEYGKEVQRLCAENFLGASDFAKDTRSAILSEDNLPKHI